MFADTPSPDLMIEAKDKEQAVLQLYRTYGLGPVDEATLRPPGWRGDKTPRKKKAVPADVDDGSDEDLELVDGGGKARAKRPRATKKAGEGEGEGEKGVDRKEGEVKEVKADGGEDFKGNAKGKKGAKGAEGAMGDKGAKGPTGDKGVKRVKGKKTKKQDRPISAKWEGAGSAGGGAPTGDDAAALVDVKDGAPDVEMADVDMEDAPDVEMDGAPDVDKDGAPDVDMGTTTGDKPSSRLQDAMRDASDGAEEAAQAVSALPERKRKRGKKGTAADTGRGGACDGGIDTTEGVGASIDGEVVVVGGEVAGKKRKRGSKGAEGEVGEGVEGVEGAVDGKGVEGAPKKRRRGKKAVNGAVEGEA
ncbi:hypothetical protein K525DRAFT_281518 [Schizophyllum commune Loenen D]|nr:hypothetical protein K525DRAFT_281518 [Schizophyllum commune Loenen D]